MQGADYVIATGRPVLYLGGFGGQDQVETPDSLASLVASGDLRYVYLDGPGEFGRGPSVSSWVIAHGTPIQGFETSTQNFGAPDGTLPGSAGNDARPLRGFGGAMQATLYQLTGGS